MNRKIKISMFVFACLLQVMLNVGIAEAQQNKNGVASLSCGILINGCDFILQKFSNQSSDPFLFYGEIVDTAHPRYESFSKSLEKFQTVEDCLRVAETNNSPNQTYEFDWTEMRSSEDLEVCFFRLFNSFSSNQVTKSWMESVGFSIRLETTRSPRDGPPRAMDKAVLSVNAMMNEETAISTEISDFYRRIRGWFGKHLSVSVFFNSHERIEYVGVTVISK